MILPGGFAYGDYLRAGALARFSPVMESVAKFAAQGGPVLGICNGFQVLLEAGLLSGRDADQPRASATSAATSTCGSRTTRPPFTSLYPKGSVVKMPIGHMEGNYTAPPDVLDALEREGRVVFRYCDAGGRVTDEANPNGAARGIAGIVQRGGQRRGPDAAPGPLLREPARQRSGNQDVRVRRGGSRHALSGSF